MVSGKILGLKINWKGANSCLLMHTELVYMFAHSIHFVSCLKELGYTP